MEPRGARPSTGTRKSGWVEPPAEPAPTVPDPDPFEAGAARHAPNPAPIPNAGTTKLSPEDALKRFQAGAALLSQRAAPVSAPPGPPAAPRRRAVHRPTRPTASDAGTRLECIAQLSAELTAGRLAILDHDLVQMREPGPSSPLLQVLAPHQGELIADLKTNEVLIRAGRPLDRAEWRWSESDYERELRALRDVRLDIKKAETLVRCSLCGQRGTFYARLPVEPLWPPGTLIQCLGCHQIVCLSCSSDHDFYCSRCGPPY